MNKDVFNDINFSLVHFIVNKIAVNVYKYIVIIILLILDKYIFIEIVKNYNISWILLNI